MRDGGKYESLKNPTKIYYQSREGYKDYYLINGHVILFAKDRLIEIDGCKSFSTPITDIWDDVLPNDLHNEGGVELKKGKKPEKLLARIIELCSKEGDIILDFFAGSGTTGAVALKMKRRFIMCEQMDYIEESTKQRLINVIKGENRGVSSTYGWQGGGAFVYCELARLNQAFATGIQDAQNDKELAEVWKSIRETGFVSCYVNPKDIDEKADDFKSLSFDDKKRLFMELLDANQLYVNYCDIDDESFDISEEDKAFTKSFYGDN